MIRCSTDASENERGREGGGGGERERESDIADVISGKCNAASRRRPLKAEFTSIVHANTHSHKELCECLLVSMLVRGSLTIPCSSREHLHPKPQWICVCVCVCVHDVGTDVCVCVCACVYMMSARVGAHTSAP